MLLELILALAVFTLAVVGLTKSLQVGIRHASILNRENDIRIGLRSFLEEVRRKPVAEVAQTFEDQRLGVIFQSELDEVTVKDRNGGVLRDLYKLRVSVIDQGSGQALDEAVEMWIYKTQTEGRR